MDDSEIVKQLIEENKEGLERLAAEEPAAERRSRIKRFKRFILDIFKDEKKVGTIKA